MTTKPMRILHYAFGIISVLAALGLIELIGETRAGYASLLYAAVAGSAWLGGLGPGLLATLTASAVSAYFFIDPARSFYLGVDDLLRLFAFTFVAVLISYLHESSRRAQETMRRAHEEAIRANQAKDQFLAVLGHELRNPLAPVLSTAALMEQDPNLPPATREEAAMIRRNVELEVRLIDDLLDLSRIVSGKLKVQPETVDVHQLVHTVAGICRDELSVKNQRLLLQLDASGHWVQADPARLQQILWNLLKNASKFSPVGAAIRICSGNESDGNLQLQVIDSGIGIEPDQLTRIFDAFEQGSESITRQFGGLGLGLAISQRLTEAQGGTLTADSAGHGQGAIFTLRLPTVPEPVARTVQQTAQDLGARRRLRILLVEDHPDTRTAMARVLTRLGQEVHAVGSVADALKAVEIEPIDLLLSDLSLPDGSGLEIAKQLRAGGDVYAVALSGHGSEEAIRQSRDAGFNRYMIKPVTLDQMENLLRELNCTAASPSASI